MLFAQFVDTFATVFGAYVPVVVGVAVAIGVLTTLLALSARSRRVLNPAVLQSSGTPAASPLTEDNALNWDPPEQSYADRRGSVRREGGPVRVVLSSTSFRNGVNDGYVIDRSTGGLRIAMQSAVAPESTLQVRAVHAPDTIGFVTVTVRSCRKNGDHFEIGCEFEKTPPWNVLLLFG